MLIVILPFSHSYPHKSSEFFSHLIEVINNFFNYSLIHYYFLILQYLPIIIIIVFSILLVNLFDISIIIWCIIQKSSPTF